MRKFAGQVGWSLGAKIWYAALQLVTLVLLARGLSPSDFAWVASVNVVMFAVPALNGFGLMRQIQYRRSVDPDDPMLPSLYAARLRYSWASGALWALVSLVLLVVTGDEWYLAVVPIALWLALDQTVTVWNALSIVDGRTQDLVPSYTLRRVPAVVALAVAVPAGWDVVWAWSLALTFGTALAVVEGRRRQVSWARGLWPTRREADGPALPLDLGFWWTEVGTQLRDLDVAVVSAVSSTAGGAFALPARFVKPMNMITLAAASVAFPRLARRKQVTSREVLLGTLIGTAPVTLIAGTAALAAPLLPRLVGEDYDGTVAPFRVLCLVAVLTGYSAIFVVFLQSRSSEATRHVGYVAIPTAIAQLAATGVGAHLDGAMGAAWASVLVNAAVVAVLWALAVHHCRIPAPDKPETPETLTDEVALDG